MVDPQTLAQLFVTGLMIGSIYGLIALCFHVIYNATNILNFTIGEFVVLGSFLLYTFHVPLGMSLPIAFILMVIAVGLAGAIFERVAIYPLQGLPIFIPIIVTIGASFLMQTVMMLAWGTRPLIIPPFSGDESINVMGVA